jgi:hypothetical protein
MDTILDAVQVDTTVVSVLDAECAKNVARRRVSEERGETPRERRTWRDAESAKNAARRRVYSRILPAPCLCQFYPREVYVERHFRKHSEPRTRAFLSINKSRNPGGNLRGPHYYSHLRATPDDRIETGFFSNVGGI